MKFVKASLPAALLVVTASAQAATTTSPIVVTATRTAQSVDESLAPVTVITSEDIERRQIRSVPELLKGVPGITVSNNGGAGKTTSVFLRGTESDHIQVLIDGIKVGSATLGTIPFQDIPIDQIERVEIVRGPRSSLYGSEAIGGVIQIFTKRGGGDTRVGLSLGGGSFGTQSGTLSLSGGGDNAWFSLSLSKEQTDGFNACSGVPNVAGCFTDEPDDDGFDNRANQLRFGFKPSDNSEFNITYLNSDSETEFDGSFQNESETEQEVLGASLKLSPSENSDVTLRLGKSEDLSENFKDGVFASRFDTERDSALIQGDFYIGDNSIVTAGIDHQDDSVDSSLAFDVTSRDNTGVFLQYQGSMGNHDVIVGLREDDNEQFGKHTTGNITVGHRMGGNTRATIAYGTAFKAPTFNELYFPGFGNPDLDPEESNTLELGFSGGDAGANWSLNLFKTEVEDLIGFDPVTFAPVNIDNAEIKGIEAVFNRTTETLAVSATLTLLDHEDTGGGFNDGNALPRRAEETLRIDVDRNMGRFSIGGTLFFEGDKFDDLGNNNELDSYARVDVRGKMQINDDWSVQAHIENLLDEEYETAQHFNQSERAFFLTFRYQPKK